MRSAAAKSRSIPRRSNCPTSTTWRTAVIGLAIHCVSSRRASIVAAAHRSAASEGEHSWDMLIPLADRAWVIPGGVNIGVLANDDGQIVLVDTGLNESSAKKALKVVREELGGEVVGVLTTHAHADHFGGNATIVKRTGAVVHAPKFDEAFLRYPLLQPASLFGGADPLDALRGNFLLADASPVDAIVEPGAHEIAGIRIEAVPLYGHSPGQLGYLAGDVFFCADVVLPANVLDKYRIPYLFSLTEHLAASGARPRHSSPGGGCRSRADSRRWAARGS